MDIYRDAAVVRALASHQWGPSSIPGLGVVSGLSLLLVLVFSLRGFFRVLPFSPLFINVKFALDYCKHFNMSLWLEGLRKHSVLLTLNNYITVVLVKNCCICT